MPIRRNITNTLYIYIYTCVCVRLHLYNFSLSAHINICIYTQVQYIQMSINPFLWIWICIYIYTYAQISVRLMCYIYICHHWIVLESRKVHVQHIKAQGRTRKINCDPSNFQKWHYLRLLSAGNVTIAEFTGLSSQGAEAFLRLWDITAIVAEVHL